MIRKRYPYLGIGAVILAFAAIGISISLSPWFSWTNNALSDLGNTLSAQNVSSGAAYVFDGGLAVSGILTLLFTLFHLRDARYHWKYIVWGVPLTISSIDLSLIGIFNESFGGLHLIVSAIFFFMMALTLFLYSYVSFPLGAPKIGAIAASLGIFCAAVWIARFPWHGVAIQETVTSVASAIFVILIAQRIVRWPECVTETGRPTK
ncbi:MAG: DUF998 domain-containing protein [Nitrososphaerales archaeon]